MKALFQWLELHPNAYWVGVVLASGALLASVFQSLRRPEDAPRRDWIFALLLLLFLLAWRWPAFFWPQGLNPDESQLVSGAITLTRDPVFWRSVDAGTCGPLNIYALLPLHWLGLPLDYLSARLTGLLLVWGTLLCGYRMLRPTLGLATARVGLLPGALFFATIYNGDFIHYSTEHLPLFLFSAAWLLWAARDGSHPARPGLHPAWLAAGVCMGLLPWAKLQAAPLAAALALWGVILALGDRHRAWSARCARIAWLAVAALTPSFVILVLVWATGQWEHFIKSYLASNLAYVGQGGDRVGAAGELLDRMQGTWNFPALALTTFAIVLAATFHGLVRRQRPSHLFVAGGSFTAVAALCVLVPHRGFLHYMLFLVPPLTWWGAAALGEFRPKADGRPTPALVFLVASLALAAIPVGLRLRGPPLEFLTCLTDRWTRPYDELGFLLRKLRQPGDTLTIWGWYSHLHVESGLAQATREAASQRQIDESLQRDTYYRPTYLADLQRNQPAFFVDAVGPRAFGYTKREQSAHETFPALAGYVAEHYRLIDDAGHARLYVRRSRLDELGLGAEDIRRLIASARQNETEMLAGKIQSANTYQAEVAGRGVLVLLPPAEMTWQLTGVERGVLVQYGFHPRAAQEATDGAEFIVELRPPNQPARPVFYHFLDPPRRAADRGFQSAEIVLAPYPPGTELAVRTTNGQHNTDAWDWVFLYQLRFTRAETYLPAQFPGFNRVPDVADAPHSYLLKTDQGLRLMLDTPAALNYTLRGTESSLEFDYGFQEGAYRDGGQTDGATIVVELYPPGQPSRVLFEHHLDPRNNPADQGRQHAKVTLPPTPPGWNLILRTDPGPQGNNSWDWIYVTNFQLK